MYRTRTGVESEKGDKIVCLWRCDESCVRYYGSQGEHMHDYAMQSRRRREQGNVVCDVRRRRGRPKGTEDDDRVGLGSRMATRRPCTEIRYDMSRGTERLLTDSSTVTTGPGASGH